MSEVRPSPIVRALEELAQTLLTVAQREVDAPLAVLEQEVLAAVRAALPQLLGAVLRLSQRSLWPEGRVPAVALSRLRGTQGGAELAATDGDDGVRAAAL